MSEIQHLVVMGVSGSGKTTVARLLAERLGWPFAEADDHHPEANVAKMALVAARSEKPAATSEPVRIARRLRLLPSPPSSAASPTFSTSAAATPSG